MHVINIHESPRISKCTVLAKHRTKYPLNFPELSFTIEGKR
jgi:hypothetical protein